MNQHCPTLYWGKHNWNDFTHTPFPMTNQPRNIAKLTGNHKYFNIKRGTFCRISSSRRHRRPRLKKSQPATIADLKAFFVPDSISAIAQAYGTIVRRPRVERTQNFWWITQAQSLCGTTSTCARRIQFIVRAINGESSTCGRWLFDHTQRRFICD